MKRTLFLLLFFYNTGYAIKSYSIGDTLNVWTKELNIRIEPNQKSFKIVKIEYGSQVVVLEQDLKKITFSKSLTPILYDDNDSLVTGHLFEGHWVKVRYKNFVGYVFDAFLSKMPPFKLEINDRTYQLNIENIQVYLVRNGYGIQKSIGRFVKNDNYYFSNITEREMISEHYLTDIDIHEAMLFGLIRFHMESKWYELNISKGNDGVIKLGYYIFIEYGENKNGFKIYSFSCC